ncbi:DUF3575 domain-containing protein [Pedobacter glucosidilyticus]|uniref:DUF3575 domain-containing protein n=1 Tax=Pedobacter glucosidilyticus TaxID=1122941 RepID=UPI00042094EE|nr:DUF3575 domain-containing protein [Pedobacter glucosidilyticus]
MKKTLLVALVFTGMLTSKLSAQEVNNTVKINPLSALFRIGSVFYERKMSDNLSLQLGVAYTGLKLDETKFSGFSTTPELRYYPKANALNGLYFGPFLRYQNYTVKDDINEGSYTSFGGGAVLGRQWVYKSGFTLDLFFGPSYNAGKIKADDGSGEPEVNGAIDGFGLRAGIAIGFGF